MEKIEVVPMTVLEQVDDMLKRLHQIENIIMRLGPVIDMANEYEDRLAIIEKTLLRRLSMANGMKTKSVKMNAMKKVKVKKPAKQKVKMPKKAGYQKAGSKKEIY